MDCLLFFGKTLEVLPNDKLPTLLEITKNIKFNLSSKNYWKKNEKNELINQIALNLVEIWKSAYIQTQTILNITKRLKKEILEKTIDYARRDKKKILFGDNKEQFLSSLDKVFDIARCNCFKGKVDMNFMYSDCSCLPEEKLVNFQGYKLLLHDKTARILISDEEKNQYEHILSGTLLSYLSLTNITILNLFCIRK